MSISTLCDAALDVLGCGNAVQKAERTCIYAQNWRDDVIDAVGVAEGLQDRPARPEKPELKDARDMPRRRKAGSDASKVALLHAIAHIELNAIDLAWDIMARFSGFSEESHSDQAERVEESEDTASDPSTALGMTADIFTLPKAFFDDWIKVADDEAKHFLMLESRLGDFGATYGDLPAHDGLWEASVNTAEDFAARLAIVPMVLEARGLDVTPNMIEMMRGQGDNKTADMLQIIHDDEVTHVRAGTVWFEAWCAHHGHDVQEYWQTLVKQYFDGRLKPPFNHPSREDAGMIRDWYEPLADINFADQRD